MNGASICPTALPWHNPLWLQLLASIQQRRLAHAYLLSGQTGLGKSMFAQALAKTLLCDRRGEAYCGQCKTCQLFDAGSHPDFRQLNSVDDKAIGIDEIREMSRYFSLTRQYGVYKIAVIFQAERLSVAAANALLKTLEEPPAGALLLLVSRQPSLLPITVRSRCQLLRFQVPDPATAQGWLANQLQDPAQAEAWLEQAQGAPLTALAMARRPDEFAQRQSVIDGARQLCTGQSDPLTLADSYLKFGAKNALYILWRWKLGMLKRLMSNQPCADSVLAKQIGARGLLQRLDALGLAVQRLECQVNEQLLLEDILISWM